jgi:type IV pilus assembly protein PilW
MKHSLFDSNHRARQGGLTLVEIIVALAIGLVLLGAISEVFVGSKRAYHVQDALSRVQENGRFAVDFLSRDIRMAAFPGNCPTDTIVPKNTLNAGYIANFSVGIQGFDAGTSTWTPTLDASISGASPAPTVGSDIITIRHAGASTLPVTATMPNTSADLPTVAGNDLVQGDILMVCDPGVKAAIIQITNANPDTSGSVVHNTGATVSPGNSTKDMGGIYGPGSEITVLTTTTYYVGPAASGTGTSLWRITNGNNPVELIEGVENMQLQYGVNTDGDSDKTADIFVKASSLTATDWPNVVSVRLSLLLATIPDNMTQKSNPYTFNGATVTPTDKRIRHVFSQTIQLRNRSGG